GRAGRRCDVHAPRDAGVRLPRGAVAGWPDAHRRVGRSGDAGAAPQRRRLRSRAVTHFVARCHDRRNFAVVWADLESAHHSGINSMKTTRYWITAGIAALALAGAGGCRLPTTA